jgi:N-terminal half of MaoC dehydratase
VYWPADPPRLYWDAAYAETTPHRGIIAPEEFNPFAWMAAEKHEPQIKVEGVDPGRTEKMLGVTPPPVRFQLNGGSEVEYAKPMRPGDVITSVMRLAQYNEREGRHGLMLFTIFEVTWTNQNADVVKTQRRTLIRY